MARGDAAHALVCKAALRHTALCLALKLMHSSGVCSESTECDETIHESSFVNSGELVNLYFVLNAEASNRVAL